MPNIFKKTIDQQKAVIIMKSAATRILLYGGSRSGKTMIILFAIVFRALKFRQSRHLILRRHFNTANTAIGLDTMPKLYGLLGLKVSYNGSHMYWILPNKSEIWLGGLDNKERADKVLGKEYASIFFNEISEMTFASVETALSRLAQKIPGCINKAYFDCNPTSKLHWGYKMFIEKINPANKALWANQNMIAFLQMNPEGNRDNIAEGYIEDTLDNMSKSNKTRFRDGEWSSGVEGAIWKAPWIDDNRVSVMPDEDTIESIVVAVDPSGDDGSKDENGETSNDAIGIVVALRTTNGHYYVIEDATMNGSALEWSTKVVEVAERNDVDCIVGEQNYGGDMVRHTIKSAMQARKGKIQARRIELVTSSRGKRLRAEPVSALYEDGLVHHVGYFHDLETEQVEWVEGKDSPNRIDALVFAITKLSGVRAEVTQERVTGFY